MSAAAESGAMPALALLAGGLATRLRPITEKIPKSMVEVAGEPFIAHQLRLLARAGVGEIVVCAGHLGEQIERYAGDGARFGCRLRYSSDGRRPLGTGGALRNALELLGESFMVMYGDSYLEVSFRAVWQAYRKAAKPALMTVYRNEGRWDASNVEFSDGVIRRYDKIERIPTMHHIDYGLSVMAAAMMREWPAHTAFDLADVYGGLVRRGQLAGYEVSERFYEIGSLTGLAETDAMLRRRNGKQT